MDIEEKRPAKILAVASGGGHWQQLMQLTEAFEGADLVLVSTTPGLGKVYGYENVLHLNDFNQDQPVKVLRGFWETFKLVRRVRPDIVISTGAAPGVLSLFWARLMGSRTIWIDSIANSEKLSLSGRFASRFSHIALTQWEHLAAGNRPIFRGSVL